MGINVVMLTGDNQRTAEAIRQRLNIPQVIAGVLPQDKENTSLPSRQKAIKSP